jgi:hypothetical protein
MDSNASVSATISSAAAESAQINTTKVTMIAKYGKQKIEISCINPTSTTLGTVKAMLHEKTGILPKRQKLIGLKGKGDPSSALVDGMMLSDLKVKGVGGANESGIIHQFILMGTPEEQIFVDPSDKADLPDIIDDFDLDFNAGSEEVSRVLRYRDIIQKKIHCIIHSFLFNDTKNAVDSTHREGR